MDSISLDHSLIDFRPRNHVNTIDEQVVHNIFYSLFCCHYYWDGKELGESFLRFLAANTRLKFLADNSWKCDCYSEKPLDNLKRPDFVFEISKETPLKIFLELKWKPRGEKEWERAKNQINGYLNDQHVSFVVLLVRAEDSNRFSDIRDNAKLVIISYEKEITQWLNEVTCFDTERLIESDKHFVAQLFALHSIIHSTRSLPRKERYSRCLSDVFSFFIDLVENSFEKNERPDRVLSDSVSTETIKGRTFVRIIYSDKDVGWYSINVLERNNRTFFELALERLTTRLSADGKRKEEFSKRGKNDQVFKKLGIFRAGQQSPIMRHTIKYENKVFSTDFRLTEEKLRWPYGYYKNIAKDFYKQFLAFKGRIDRVFDELRGGDDGDLQM